MKKDVTSDERYFQSLIYFLISFLIILLIIVYLSCTIL